ncbi:MAG: glycosyltransferase family 1 protein [Solirubrobacterales bacterium]|nr:glycosyltransferase family 1 protein [Solirubrobacterales bacterium]
MRIAFVTEVFVPAIDGVVTRLRRTLEQLQRHGDEVLVVAPAGGPPSYAGARVVGVPGLRIPLYPDGSGYPDKRVSLPVPRLGAALREFAPDVIHAINPFVLGAGAVHYAHRQRIPLVASYHANIAAYSQYYGLGALESLGWRYVVWLHNHADVNLCTSVATIEQLRARGVQRLGLWPYGIETDRFSPRWAQLEWRVRLSAGHPDRVILLCVGRLAKEKSLQRLVPVVRELDGISLAIVGDGPVRPKLERLFSGTPTTFLGLLSGEALSRAYASADAFLFPSDSETLGMVMLEAHAAGLPVVTADTPAARELVRNGVDGLRYDAHDPSALVSAVRRLVESRELRRGLGARARAAVAGATWRHATDELRCHYLGVIGAWSGPDADDRTPMEPAEPQPVAAVP